MKSNIVALILLTFVGFAPAQERSSSKVEIQWRAWSSKVFEEAKRDRKFVLLDLEAVWCHWCHVMAETTYKRPDVIRLIGKNYIAIRVDQDSRPDLANRYEDYGWPATVIFAADGSELVKRRGYIEPKDMAAVLARVVAHPVPEEAPEPKIALAKDPLLISAAKSDLLKRYISHYDFQNGSWGMRYKLLDWDGVEFAIERARTGDAQAAHMARQTLDAEMNLVDPVWGGVYQYSVGGNWNEPHFEKIMQMQAENLRCYALGYAEWHDPKYLKAVEDIHRFLVTFLLSPEGGFYTSQDADVIQGKHSAEYFKLNDSERRKRGIPRVDKHLYARENGWVIRSLAVIYGVSGEQKYLDEATTAANWVIKNRSLPKGGFKHGAADAAGPYLGDSLAMSQAFIDLYSVTGDRQWLAKAEAAAKYATATFSAHVGYNTAVSVSDPTFHPRPNRDENVALARLANRLAHYTGNQQYRGIALHAMSYVAAPQIMDDNPAAGTLLADYELTTVPTHITVVGHKDAPEARDLFRAGASYAAPYRRLEWWDSREGRLPNPDVQYPEMKKPAAFICTNGSCSAPIYKATDIHSRADLLNHVKVPTDAGK